MWLTTTDFVVYIKITLLSHILFGIAPLSTVLDQIVAHKQTEVAAARQRLPFSELQTFLSAAPPVRNFAVALQNAHSPGLIAEVKKASPSAGVIREDFCPVTIATAYQAAGAACLSVLTDERFFQGHLDYLKQIRAAVQIPVMRKEFIIDRYQILEARVAGADCVLLIAECLDDDALQDLHDFAIELGMETLIELYDPENLERVLRTGTRLVGVNNRNLRTFETSLEHTFDLKRSMPQDVCLISESGIRTFADIQRLRDAGVAGVLVGESLMRCPDIEVAVRTLMTGQPA
jgi:indole-3-glycerol phosphate synthase